MTKHRHITKTLLLAARRGQVSWRHLAEVLLERLGERCPGCRREAEAAAAEEIPEAAYREPVSRAVRLEVELRRYEEDRQSAGELLALLRVLSPAQRLLRIRNAPTRFANVALGESVLDEARACLPHDPQGSLGWAQTTSAVVETYTTPYDPHRILGLAYEGNAHRALGDFDRARTLLAEAWRLVVDHEVTDLDLAAELHSLFGSLASDLGDFVKASEHLENAAALYKTLADDERLGRVLMKLGALHGLVDNLPAALEADRAAVALLTPEEHPRLHLCARVNLAYHLVEAGRPQAAQDELVLYSHLFAEHSDAHLQVRVDWLEARLAAELGDPAGAERGYLAVRDELVRQGQGFHVALACLDLAALYHRQKRFGEVEEVAGQAVELFQAHALHQDALTALLLVRDAARQRTLTAKTILRVAGFLREAERSPGARFQRPN